MMKGIFHSPMLKVYPTEIYLLARRYNEKTHVQREHAFLFRDRMKGREIHSTLFRLKYTRRKHAFSLGSLK